jgi:hypothetical protein
MHANDLDQVQTQTGGLLVLRDSAACELTK